MWQALGNLARQPGLTVISSLDCLFFFWWSILKISHQQNKVIEGQSWYLGERSVRVWLLQACKQYVLQIGRFDAELDDSSSLKDEQRMALFSTPDGSLARVRWNTTVYHGSHWGGDTSKPCAATKLLNWQKIWFVCYKCDTWRFYPITFHVFVFFILSPEIQNLSTGGGWTCPALFHRFNSVCQSHKNFIVQYFVSTCEKLDHVGRRVRFENGDGQFTKIKTHILITFEACKYCKHCILFIFVSLVDTGRGCTLIGSQRHTSARH